MAPSPAHPVQGHSKHLRRNLLSEKIPIPDRMGETLEISWGLSRMYRIMPDLTSLGREVS